MVPPLPPNPTMRRALYSPRERGQKDDMELAEAGEVCLSEERKAKRNRLTQSARFTEGYFG
jgi:hypothetical protein